MKSFEAEDVVDREFTGAAESLVQGSRDYNVEHAKSARAACLAKDCNEKIAKDELRIGVIPPVPDGWKSSRKFVHW